MPKLFLSEPARARTEDPKIKSLLLYQLSYGLMQLLHILSSPKFLSEANPLTNKNDSLFYLF